MIEPTVNVNDVYQMGNDYAPKVDELYQTVDAEGNSTYADGIYTQLNPALSAEGGEVAKTYAINGQDYAGEYWKNTDGFNKRTILTNPNAELFDEMVASAKVTTFRGCDGSEVDTETVKTMGTSEYAAGDVVSDVKTLYLVDTASGEKA